jgi:hypothetical protein
VAFVGENETVRTIMKFGPHQGKYMIHSHNLVHGDHDMMAQFRTGHPTEVTTRVRPTRRRTCRPGPLGPRAAVDCLTVDRLTVDRLTVDRLTVDCLTVDRLTVDRLTAGAVDRSGVQQ